MVPHGIVDCTPWLACAYEGKAAFQKWALFEIVSKLQSTGRYLASSTSIFGVTHRGSTPGTKLVTSYHNAGTTIYQSSLCCGHVLRTTDHIVGSVYPNYNKFQSQGPIESTFFAVSCSFRFGRSGSIAPPRSLVVHETRHKPANLLVMTIESRANGRVTPTNANTWRGDPTSWSERLVAAQTTLSIDSCQPNCRIRLC